MKTLKKDEIEILQKADTFCASAGFGPISLIDELEIYFMKKEVLITKPVKARSFDGLYGDMDTLPQTILMYIKDKDTFETTEYTEKYLKKAS